HDPRIVLAIDAGDSQADGGGDESGAIAEGLFHHVVEDLLHFELAGGLEVGTAAPRLVEDGAGVVGKMADGLRAAGVNPKNERHVPHVKTAGKVDPAGRRFS